MSGEFDPIGVGIHEDGDGVPSGDKITMGSVTVQDNATEGGHPIVHFYFTDSEGKEYRSMMSLKQFLITMKLVMDGYPEYVREVYGI